jgi:hypothetical protein
MKNGIYIGILAIVMSFAASCGGGAAAPAPQPPADTTGPAITITGVEDGQTVGGDVVITAAAADPSGVVDFDFEVNENNVATENDGSMSFTWHTAFPDLPIGPVIDWDDIFDFGF